MVNGLEWLSQFDNLSDYFTFMVPNLISQSIFINQYLGAVETYT